MFLCNQYTDKQELAPTLDSTYALCKQLNVRVVCSICSVCLSFITKAGQECWVHGVTLATLVRLMQSRVGEEASLLRVDASGPLGSRGGQMRKSTLSPDIASLPPVTHPQRRRQTEKLTLEQP